MYYLNTKYYCAEIGRFLSSDNLVINIGGDVRGYSLFVYCFNNPINLTDSSGNWPQWVKNAANWVYSKIVKPVTKVVNKVLSKINAPTIHDLEGTAYQIGGSAGFPVNGFPASAGADLVMMTNGKGDLTYFGLTGAAGIGTPGAEGHIEYGMTESNSEEYNIYDLVDQFFIKLMED